jgi:hypothetical protein
MELTSNKHIAHEAFIRRASVVEMPFMLKGSYISRQYFPEHVARYPADLDWVYLHYLEDPALASARFSEWMIAVTELKLNDGVNFRSFRKDEFWRMMDYSMADDFPTVNTDIVCQVDGKELRLNIDISFNLDVEQPPIPLRYKPFRGDDFIIPYTVPLSLQVSWKIHQTLVRPRFKDLFDLLYLVKNPAFTTETLRHTIQALVNECAADNIDLEKLNVFLSYNFKALFPSNSGEPNWRRWRHGANEYDYIQASYWDEVAFQLTDVDILPNKLDDFLQLVSESLRQAGIDMEIWQILPIADRVIRKGYRDLSNSSLYDNSNLRPHSDIDKPLVDPATFLNDHKTLSMPKGNKTYGFFKFIRNWFS